MTEEEKKKRARLPGRVIGGAILIFLAGMILIWMTDGIRNWAKGSPQPVVIKYPRPEPPEAPSISVPATNTIYMSSPLRINNPLGPRQKIRAKIIGDYTGITYTMTRINGGTKVSLPMFPAGDTRNPGLIVADYEAMEFQLDRTNLKNPRQAEMRVWFE